VLTVCVQCCFSMSHVEGVAEEQEEQKGAGFMQTDACATCSFSTDDASVLSEARQSCTFRHPVQNLGGCRCP